MYIVRLFGLKSKLCSWRLLGYPGIVPRTRSCMRTTRAMGCSAWSADTYQRFDLACPRHSRSNLRGIGRAPDPACAAVLMASADCGSAGAAGPAK